MMIVIRSFAAAAILTAAGLLTSPLASAAPDFSVIVNTTCTYPQVIAALGAKNPAALAEFNSRPTAQMMLQQFLASPPPARQGMIDHLLSSNKGRQKLAKYIGTFMSVAKTCNKY